MRTIGLTLSLAGIALLGACSRGTDAGPDDALKNDLALAAQARPYAPQQFVGPNEMAQGATALAPQYTPAPRAIQPVARTASTARRTTRTSTSARSSGTRSTARTYPAPEPEVRRNTKRDAAIGAVAGAAIGAATSRDKVKGAIIGAAAGGILGGIIGHTVDVQRP